MTSAQSIGFSGTTRISDYQRKKTGEKVQPEMTQENDSFLEKVTAADTDLVTFRQIAEWTGEKANTISARYFPKVVMAHEGLEGFPALQSAPGKPTGYAAKSIALFLDMGKDLEAFVTELRQRYSKGSENFVECEIVEDDKSVTESDTQILSNVTSALARLDERQQDASDSVLARAAMAIALRRQQTQVLGSSQKKSVAQQAYDEEIARLAEEEENMAQIEAARLKAREDFLKLKEMAQDL